MVFQEARKERFSMRKTVAIFGLCLFISNIAFCNKKELAIIGCGRSGTGYSSRFFSCYRIQLSHETAKGRDGICSWSMLFNSYRPFFDSPKGSLQDYKHIFHQVRHPLRVIDSWLHNYHSKNREELAFIRFHLPQIKKNEPLITQFAKYWVYWNQKAENVAEFTYQVEKMESLVPTFESYLGRKLSISPGATLPPKNFNSYKSYASSLTWEKLKRAIPHDLYEQVVELACRYGYEMPED